MHKRAKIFNEVEKKLNELNFENIKCGSIVSLFLDRKNNDPFHKGTTDNMWDVAKYFVRAFQTSKSISFPNKVLLFFKTGNYPHHERIHSIFTSDKKIREVCLSVVIDDSGDDEILKKEILRNFNIIDFTSTLSFIVFNVRKISKIISALHLNSAEILVFLIHLYLQLLRATAIKKWLQKNRTIEWIAGDYDRGVDSALFFAVADSLNIKNFTIQHGVINPPVGYTPLICKEIWVWGNMTKLLLVQQGVDEKCIRVTGTPIIREVNQTVQLRSKYKNKYGLNPGNTVVLALSAPNVEDEDKLVRYFKSIKIKYSNVIANFFVKIHPSRSLSQYEWITNEYGMKILSQSIPFEEYVNIVDIQLAHSSGLATEMLYFNKKVGIVDILESDAGNGTQLNKFFKVPLLKNVEDFGDLLTTTLKVNCNDIYHSTGDSAIKVIQSEIFNILNRDDI